MRQGGGRNTESFEITSGVKQGDVLSPELFIVVVDSITRRVIEDNVSSDWVTNESLPYLAYADDNPLHSNDISDMNRMTEKLEQEAGKGGLEINKRKAK